VTDVEAHLFAVIFELGAEVARHPGHPRPAWVRAHAEEVDDSPLHGVLAHGVLAHGLLAHGVHPMDPGTLEHATWQAVEGGKKATRRASPPVVIGAGQEAIA
jgi:hypothetical protein